MRRRLCEDASGAASLDLSGLDCVPLQDGKCVLNFVRRESIF